MEPKTVISLILSAAMMPATSGASTKIGETVFRILFLICFSGLIIIFAKKINKEQDKESIRKKEVYDKENEEVYDTENILEDQVVDNESERSPSMELERVKLWSNLKIRPTTRTEIQCPNDLQVSLEEFFEALKQKLSDNRLPAMAELCEIQWDDSENAQNRIVIKYNDTNVASNIIRILIGLDSIGNFSYIEEKVMIIPPTLPKKPEEVKQRGCLLSFVLSICGFIMACITVLGVSFQIIGGLILIISIVFGIVLSVRDAKLSQKEQKILNDSWEQWEKQVAEIVHMSNQDDIFGRFILAVSSTVEQVTKALFIDKQAAVINKDKEEWTQKQIEDELEKRRKEFK